jgi:hypothetical protein
MIEGRLCFDCKWLTRPQGQIYLDSALSCDNPKNMLPDPVLGGEKKWHPSWLRSPLGEHLCGPNGNWWEAANA